MPQILKAEVRTNVPVTIWGVKNVFSHFLYEKSFVNVNRRQKAWICQILAVAISLLMIVPVAIILYYVINIFF